MRELPPDPTSPIACPSSGTRSVRDRKISMPLNSPLVSPKSSSPYLTDSDFGIQLGGYAGIKASDLIMTPTLISKVLYG